MSEVEITEITEPPVATSIEGTSSIGVTHRDGMLRAIATRAIAAGERIVTLFGEIRDRPAWTSVQVDEETHIDVPADSSLEETIRRCPWRFLNHSCKPNATFRGRALFAVEPIDAGTEITFHYATTEYRLDAPFRCGCGESECLGEVRGYAHMSDEQRASIADFVLPHVVRLAEREGRRGD